MDPAVKGFLNLGIDVSLADQAAKGGLNMGAGAAETVVEIEMAEGGVEIVSPEQVDDAAAEPHAFRIAGRSAHRALGFGELIDLLRFFCLLLPGRRRLFRWLGFVALSESQGAREEPSGERQPAG